MRRITRFLSSLSDTNKWKGWLAIATDRFTTDPQVLVNIHVYDKVFRFPAIFPSVWQIMARKYQLLSTKLGTFGIYIHLGMKSMNPHRIYFMPVHTKCTPARSGCSTQASTNTGAPAHWPRWAHCLKFK